MASEGSDLPGLLRALARAERDLSAVLAMDLGVGLTDVVALAELLGAEQLGPGELGRRLGLGSGASTALADRLEAAGHARRRPHPSDRRRVVLELTDEARDRILERLAPRGRQLAALAGAYDPETRVLLADFLRRALVIYQGDPSTTPHPASSGPS